MMSVIVILRIPGNPADLENYAAGPGGEVMRQVAENGRAAGAIRHCFAAGENEIMVVDEWPDEDTFHGFFSSQTQIADIMREGGAQGPPQITVHRVLDTPDRI
jgi:hypothetical protein